MNEWMNNLKKQKQKEKTIKTQTCIRNFCYYLHYVLHYIMIYYLKILTGRKYVLIFSVVKTRLHTIVIAD